MKRLLLVLWLTTAAAAAMAADFFATKVELLVDRRVPAIKISGEIMKGDAAEFASIMKGREETVLALDSVGGNLQEAILLAHVIRELGFLTVVNEDAQCLSACFLLYAGGFLRYGQVPVDNVRDSKQKSSIGIHRATLTRAAMREKSADEARQIVQGADKMLTEALREFDVPEEIVGRVIKVPSATIAYLTYEELASMRVPPWVDELAYAKCGLTMQSAVGVEAIAKQLRVLGEIEKCRNDVLRDHRKRSQARLPN